MFVQKKSNIPFFVVLFIFISTSATAQIERYASEHNRLPEMPSAEEVNADGITVGDMQAKLLKKIEELTLYVIELKKENEKFKRELESFAK